MSDNWIALISEDPTFVPEVGSRCTARDRFNEIAPVLDQIDIKVTDKVRLYECEAKL